MATASAIDTVKMIIKDGRILNCPDSYSSVFLAEITMLSENFFCVLLVPKEGVNHIIGSTNPINLVGVGMQIAIGKNGAFYLYPINSGFGMGKKWSIWGEIEDELFSLFCFNGRYHLNISSQEIQLKMICSLL